MDGKGTQKGENPMLYWSCFTSESPVFGHKPKANLIEIQQFKLMAYFQRRMASNKQGFLMKTIYRYVLLEMLPSFLLCVAILTLLFMTNKIFLSLDLVLNKKVSISETFLLYFSLLPLILSLTIPMAMMVGTLLAFGRLSSDMEVTAFKSGGGHLLQLISPILVFGFLMTCLMLYFNDKVLPAAQFMVKKIEFNIVKKKADVAIHERVFIDQFEMLPPAKAGPILCSARFNGKLKGVMAPIIPSGSRTVMAQRPLPMGAASMGITSPHRWRAASAEAINVWTERSTSDRASRMGFPL